MTNNIGHFVIAHSSHDAEPGEHGTFDSPLTSAAQKAVRRVLRAAGGGKELITGEGWEVRDDGSVILIRDSGGVTRCPRTLSTSLGSWHRFTSSLVASRS